MECLQIDFNSVCRTCKTESIEMKSLYTRDSESGKENPRLDEMLMACASVQVNHEDGLPKVICRSCFIQLKSAYIFKELCEKTDVFLRNYMKNLKGENIKEEDGTASDEFGANVLGEINSVLNDIDNGKTEENIKEESECQSSDSREKDLDYVQVTDNTVPIYECRTCSKVFYTSEGLRSHKRIHTGKTFKCKQCDKSYTRMNHLRRHELSHGRRKMHVCKICNKTLTRLEHLKRHLVTHLKEKPFGCQTCNRGFNRAEHLQNHIKCCKGEKVHICDICSRGFNREDSLEVHRRLHENKEPVLPTLENLDNIEQHYMEIDFDDKIATDAFSDRSDGEDVDISEETMEPEVEVSENNDQEKINEIAQITNEIYAEEDPPEMLVEKAKIEDEMYREDEDTEEVEEGTGAGIDNGNDCDSDKHVKFHNDSSKKFLCSECGQRFIRNAYLVIHMRRHRGEKPFKCKFCGKGFPRTTDLTVHERYHTGEKTHLCVICGRGFVRAYNLTVHMRTHTGEKPYRCTYCDAAFAQGNDLKAHVRRHTGERFQCELCPETFLMGYLLTQHKRVVHG